MASIRVLAGASPRQQPADDTSGHVAQRVYATLVGSVPVRGPEQELCRKLASLAQLLYEQRDLSDADIEEMLSEFSAPSA